MSFSMGYDEPHWGAWTHHKPLEMAVAYRFCRSMQCSLHPGKRANNVRCSYPTVGGVQPIDF
jgi:hypothetical protein